MIIVPIKVMVLIDGVKFFNINFYIFLKQQLSEMKKTIKTLALFLLCLMCLILQASCSSDEEITNSDANSELVKEATNYLNGEIVLSTNATMNGVNKTLLPEGCPTKFKFEWSKTDAQTFTISLLDFTVGNMGMIISFKCDVKCMELNS